MSANRARVMIYKPWLYAIRVVSVFTRQLVNFVVFFVFFETNLTFLVFEQFRIEKLKGLDKLG